MIFTPKQVEQLWAEHAPVTTYDEFEELMQIAATHGAAQAKPLTVDQQIEIMERLGITVAGPASEAIEALIKEVERMHGIGEQA